MMRRCSYMPRLEAVANRPFKGSQPCLRLFLLVHATDLHSENPLLIDNSWGEKRTLMELYLNSLVDDVGHRSLQVSC